jgi:pyrimidine operon attenuation protein/uracil phosphoribosyltransferase
MQNGSKELMNQTAMNHTITRLALELIENHSRFAETVLIGLQPRGIYLAGRLASVLTAETGNPRIPLGFLDITFHRDDFRTRNEPLIPSHTQIDFLVENKKVVLIDDVLYTGRTIRAGLDALLAFGRPAAVELLVLVDRRYSRHLPIQPDYVGVVTDTITSDKVKVTWKESEGYDSVQLLTSNSPDIP